MVITNKVKVVVLGTLAAMLAGTVIYLAASSPPVDPKYPDGVIRPQGNESKPGGQ